MMKIISIFFILGIQSCTFDYTKKLGREYQSFTSDYTEKLGKGYFYRYEGGDIKDILCEDPKGAEIPSTIVDYVYNKQVILAKQKPKLPQDPLYKNEYEYKEGKDEIYYWIILKGKNVVLGPLNLKEYELSRIKYKIPNDLQLCCAPKTRQ